MDGKLARKRNASSPVGELLDHSLDGFNILSVINIIIISSLNLFSNHYNEIFIKYSIFSVTTLFVLSFTIEKAFKDEFLVPESTEAFHATYSALFIFGAFEVGVLNLEFGFDGLSGWFLVLIFCGIAFTLTKNLENLFKTLQEFLGLKQPAVKQNSTEGETENLAQARISANDSALFITFKCIWPYLEILFAGYFYLLLLSGRAVPWMKIPASTNLTQNWLVYRIFYFTLIIKSCQFLVRNIYADLTDKPKIYTMSLKSKAMLSRLDVWVPVMILYFYKHAAVVYVYCFYVLLQSFATFYIPIQAMNQCLNLKFIASNFHSEV